MSWLKTFNKIIEYEKKDNFQRLSLLIFDKLIEQGIDITQNIPSTIQKSLLYFIGHEIEKYSYKSFIEADKNFFKKYIYSDFNNFQNKIKSKLIDNNLRKEYEFIYKNYSSNFIELWLIYNNILSRLINIFISLIDLNTLQYIYDFKYSLNDTILLNIYIILIFINTFIFINNNSSTEYKNYSFYKNKVYDELNEVLINFNFINETNNYQYHSNKILDYIDNIFEEIYNNSIGFHFEMNNNARLMYQNERWINYIIFLIIKFNPIIARKINEELKIRIIVFVDSLIKFHKKLVDNAVYDKILNEIIDDPEEVKDLYLKESKILFKVNNLSHCYEDNILFTDVNIEIPKNKWIYLYGKSGDGKSTFCNFLMKSNKINIGNISYMGIHDNYNYNDIKKDISFINLNRDIFHNSSILFNLTYGLQNIDDNTYKIINHYLNLFHMTKYIDTLDNNVTSLSSGEKQRLKLIRLILHDKPIWFLDESTANLNSELELIVIKELKRIQEEKNKSVIFICHNPDIIQYSDFIMKIKNKNIYIDIEPNNLL